MSNRDVSLLSREELEAEYERSQWTLAMVLLKYLGSRAEIFDNDLTPGNKRIWYSRQDYRGSTIIYLKEDDGT